MTTSTDRVSRAVFTLMLLSAMALALVGSAPGSELQSVGPLVVFDSTADGLVPGDDANRWNIYLRDLETGVTDAVNKSFDGSPLDGLLNNDPAISADGRFVSFQSTARNLVPGEAGGSFFGLGVYVRELTTGKTERVSVGHGGVPANGDSYSDGISADGRFVVFSTRATNIDTDDGDWDHDIFVRDRVSGTTEIVSVSSGEEQGNGTSEMASISADGRFVTFSSDASNLVLGDTNGAEDVFIRDRQAGTTEMVSVSSSEELGNGKYVFGVAPLSADGRYIAFYSDASNLVPGDTNNEADIFVRDRVARTTERVSVANDGSQGNSSSGDASISADGRLVVFGSSASNLVPGDTNERNDAFVRDRLAGTTRRVSVTRSGEQAGAIGFLAGPRISADGRFVTFKSDSPNLGHIYDPEYGDTFIHDLETGETVHVSVPTTSARAGKPVLRPAKPRAGRALLVTVGITQGGKPVVSAKVSCAATVGGRSLRPVSSGYRGGTAHCSWKIPKFARGRMLRGQVGAETLNGGIRRAFQSRVA
jgi:Tol biopolymer transport system component